MKPPIQARGQTLQAARLSDSEGRPPARERPTPFDQNQGLVKAFAPGDAKQLAVEDTVLSCLAFPPLRQKRLAQ